MCTRAGRLEDIAASGHPDPKMARVSDYTSWAYISLPRVPRRTANNYLYIRMAHIKDMTGSRRRQDRGDDQYDPLFMTIADAVKTATEAADEVNVDLRRIISGKSCLGAVFAAAMDAVADTEPGNIGPSVFDAAMRAAEGAVTGSAIPFHYNLVRRSVESVPDRLVRVAARQAASDLFADIPVQDRSTGDGRLLGRMRSAAVRAAKAHLKRDGGAVLRAAAADAREIADVSVEAVSKMVLVGASVHAATVALFEVAIRQVPPYRLADAVEEACRELPEMAHRHDDLIVSLVGALAMMIANDAAYRQKYQTAVRGAEKLSRDEAADRIVDEITGNTFEAVYMALVLSAYANSDGTVFESGYEDALAAACGVDTNHVQWMRGMELGDTSPGVDGEDISQEDYLEMQQKLAKTMEWLFGHGEDQDRRKRFMIATDVDYKAAVSGGWMAGMISLYEIAYRAGYEGAGGTVGKKSQGTGRRQR